MYLESRTRTLANGQLYTRHLLRESYREGAQVKKRTIANLSNCSPEEVKAIQYALVHKHELDTQLPLNQGHEVSSARVESSTITIEQGPSFGAIWLLDRLAEQMGLKKVLGNGRAGKLALWQVMSRVLEQGSRLSAVRLAQDTAVCDILNLETFNEDDLYQNLDWLADNQIKLENKLFDSRLPNASPLFLYDVTSSYLEGTKNHFGAFGYNRDGKKGKRQIVIGLLCDNLGIPLSIEVFPGNTQDPQTFESQVKKVSTRFGGGDITFVGDRGMIKRPQIEQLKEQGFHYITAITKPQIQALLDAQELQLSMFDSTLTEVLVDKVRYVLRRNPVRAAEQNETRESKTRIVTEEVKKQNIRLQSHPKAHVEVALRKIQNKLDKYKCASWLEVTVQERTLTLSCNQQALAQIAQLDGCYALKTDLPCEELSKEQVHARYKDLAQVELAFRTSKTNLLEMRPIHVRRESRTQGHVFVVMLAYRLIYELKQRWQQIDKTVEEGLAILGSLSLFQIGTDEKNARYQVPRPNHMTQSLLDAANITLPVSIAKRDVHVDTKKPLSKFRKPSKKQD